MRCEEFGVSAETDAGIVDHPLVHRGGDNGGELSAARARGGTRQRIQDIARIARIQSTGYGGCAQRDIDDRQPVALPAGRRGRIVLKLEGDSGCACALGHQPGVRNDDEIGADIFPRNARNQFGSDAGGFAGCQRNTWTVRLSPVFRRHRWLPAGESR